MTFGIEQKILHNHLQVHCNYIFDLQRFSPENEPYVELLHRVADQSQQILDYYRYATAVHWVSAGTFVPTDLDIHIRFKLFREAMAAPDGLQQLESIAAFLLTVIDWDVRKISRRVLRFDSGKLELSTHQGEWLLMTACCYRALKQLGCKNEALLKTLADALRVEAFQELELLKVTFRDLSPLVSLEASACLAHNLGDFSRVEQLWPEGKGDAITGILDELVSKKYAALIQTNLKLYSECLAPENHRHLGLRQVKALRSKVDLIPGYGPCWDDWGLRVAKHPELSDEDRAEIVESLYHSWVRLIDSGPKCVTHSYPRAVSGIFENQKGGANTLLKLLPVKTAKEIRTGVFHTLVQTQRARFEAQWSNRALKIIRESQSSPQRASLLQTSL